MENKTKLKENSGEIAAATFSVHFWIHFVVCPSTVINKQLKCAFCQQVTLRIKRK